MNSSPACSDLISFADDELEPERAEAFHAHLVTCEVCQERLIQIWHAGARLSVLAEERAKMELTAAGSAVAETEASLPSVPPRDPARAAEQEPPPTSAVGVPPSASPPVDLPAPEPTPEVAPSAVRHPILVAAPPAAPSAVPLRGPRSASPLEAPPPRQSRWKLRLVSGGSAVVLAALVVFLLWPAQPRVQAFAELTTRPYEIRFAYPEASAYRPTRNELRGDHGSATPPEERIPYAALDALERRGDRYGAAIARVWNHEDLKGITAELGKLPQAPSVESDRAALEMQGRNADNLDPQLAEIEALRASSDPAAARASRWNYALLLSKLELPLSAGQAFQDIAGEHEPGWADEAATRADQARTMRESWASWQKADAAGQALVRSGTPVPTDLVRRFPGVMRAYFYNAVQTAPDPEHVRALGEMADELDQVSGTPVLKSYVQRVAGLDFRRRAPVARAYAELLATSTSSAALRDALTAPASPDIADIIMGAMFRLGAAPDHLAAFRALVERSHDPWFEIVLARQEAAADIKRRQWIAAEGHLRNAKNHCSDATRYQCLVLAYELGSLYQNVHRIPDAVATLRVGLANARATDEWGQYHSLLSRLADVGRFNASLAMARAYANEFLLVAQLPHASGGGASYERAAYLILAGIEILDLNGPAARNDLELAHPDDAPGLTPDNYLVAADHLSDIGRLDPRDGDLPRLQGWLAKLRASGALTGARGIDADEFEGRLLIERDRTAGRALLERAIQAADSLPADADALRPRTGALSVLMFDAARNGEHARVLALAAHELGLSAPGPCTVAMIAEDERATVAVRGKDGQDRGVYFPRRPPGERALTVPSDLTHALDGCPHVGVLAQATLQGQPGVLPDELPWSYLTGAHPAGAPPASSQDEPRTVIVANVRPPEGLHLPPLSRRVIPQAPSVTALSDAEATPQRVLAELGSATEVEFDTHALLDAGISDASHLVLSPGNGGSYALTAEAIRGARLQRHPIVVLAACESARGANYQYAAWSLPDAFLDAGARAVLAAATPIPDREAGPFFTHVLDRIRAGADPAVALRDERLSAVTQHGSRWAMGVVLFE